MPPKPGMIPSLISGWPKIADCAAIRTSQAIASSQPPPKARPLTAAIVATPLVSSSRKSAWALWISSAPLLSSSCVKALMSAPGAEQERVGGGDDQRADAVGLDLLPDLAEVLDDLRRDRVHLAVGQPGDRGLAARLELDDGGLAGGLLGVGLRVGVEALAALLAEAALGDQPLEDRRRREALAPLLLGALQPLEDRVEALDVGLHERRQQAAARVDAGAGHHPEVDVAVGGDALLEDQRGLDEGLEHELLDELLDVRARPRPRGSRCPRCRRSRRRRSWRRACRRRRASACPRARRSGRRRSRAGARRRAARCRGRAG